MNKETSIVEKVIIIILAGILDFSINYLFNIVLKVPLFLDTICLMAVLFIFGPVEALLSYIVDVACTIIRLYVKYNTVDFIYLYTLSALVIIVITWLFIRNKEYLEGTVNKVFLYILAAASISAVACSIVSGFISYFTFQKNVDDWAFDKIIFSLKIGNFGMLGTCIMGRIPLTVLDRIITTFAGFGIYKLWKRIKHEK